MAASDEYEKDLDRVLEKLPKIKTGGDRFVVPKPNTMIEGKTTLVDNFAAIADYINREPEHLMKFLLREMATAGKIDGTRAVFQGKFSEEVLASQVGNYVNEYVLCSECDRPDTHLTKSGRVLMLKCDACGAHRPLKKYQPKKVKPVSELEQGAVYDLRVEAVGNKGDGIARKSKYTIFIPQTKKGDEVRARIKNISGTIAFAEIVEEE